MKALLKVTLVLFLSTFALVINAANRFWVGASSTNWNNTANWSATSGTGSGASVPGVNDIAIFDGASGFNGNCDIDANVNVAGIQISGYTGTISQNGFTITAGSNGFSQSSGTFTGSSSAITINGTGTFALSGGTFTSTSGNFTITGSRGFSQTIFNHSAGTFNHNNGTVNINPNQTGCSQITYTIDVIAGTDFYNLGLNASPSCSVNPAIASGSGDVVNVTNDITHTDGFVTGAFAFQRNLIVGANADGGSGTITANGSGAQTYAYTSGGRTAKLDVNKSAGTLSAAGGTTDFACQGFLLQAGTFTAPSGTLNSGGIFNGNQVLFNHTGGTFNHNNGTVEINATQTGCSQLVFTIDVIPSTVLFGLKLNATPSCSVNPVITTATSDVVTALGALTHTDGLFYGSVEFEGDLIIGSNADGGTGTITATGSNNQTYSVASGSNRTCRFIVNKTGGTFTPFSGTTNLSVQSFSLLAGSFTAPSGSLNTGGFWTSSQNLFTHTGGTFNHNNGTVIINPNQSGCSQLTFTLDVISSTLFYNLQINGTPSCSVNPVITTAGADVAACVHNFTHTDGIINGLFSFQQDLFIDPTSDGGSGTITANGTGFQKYTFTAGAARTCKLVVDKTAGVLSPETGTTNLSTQSFTLNNGMFIAPTGVFNIGGIWNSSVVLFDHAGGVFDHNNGTVTLNPNHQGCTQLTFTLNVLNGTDFFNLIINGTQSCGINPIFVTATGDVVNVVGDLTHTDGTVNGDFELKGNLIVANTSDGGNGTITMNGNTAQTYSFTTGGLRTCKLIVDKSLGAVTPAGGTTDFSTQGFALFNGSFTAPSGTFNIGGSQTSSNNLFNQTGGTFVHNNGNVVLSPTAGCTQFTFTINVINNTRFYNLNLNAPTGCTNSIFANGAGDSLDVLNNLTYTDGISNNLVTAGGNVTVASTFDGGNGKLIFTGSNAQNFDLTGATALFNGSIIVDKAANNVTLLSTCTLDAGASQSISFQNGKMITTSSNLLRVDRTVGVSGGNSNSFVSGPMVRMIANNGVNNNIFFPIGAGSQYRQALLNVTHTSAANFDYTAEVKNISAQTLGLTLPGTVDKVSPVRYWQIDRSATGNLSAASVQLFYGADDGVTDNSNLRLVKGNGGNWDNIGGTGSANGSGSITSSVNFTTFSPFALANANGGTNFPGSALQFDGSGDYVALPTLSLTDFTVEFWVKKNGTGSGAFPRIISTSGDLFEISVIDAAPGVAGQVYAFGSGIPAWSIAYGSNGNMNCNLGSGVWHHMAFTRLGTTLNVYMDGSLVSTHTLNANLTSAAWRLGGRLNGSGEEGNISLDEVRIWSRALCVEEILNNKNCEIATVGSNLVSNYHFNQGIASGSNAGITSLSDATGNGNTGTLNGFTLSGSNSNWIGDAAVSSGISCAAYGPEINVKGNSVSITDGDVTPSAADHTDFGDVNVNTPFTRTYTIENLGVSPITISSIGLSGANPTLFSVGALNPAGPIAASGSATVTVTFLPTSTGSKSAILTINSNDCDEAAYDFTLQGNSVTPGAALNFDGSNDYVTIGSVIPASSSYTKEAWINVRSGAGADMNIVSSNDQPFWIEGGKLTAANSFTSGGARVQQAATFTQGAWTHVAITYDASTSTGTLYVNGTQVASGSMGTNTGGSHQIGAWNSGYTMDGSIDEVRVWNKVLCQAEIQGHMNCELSGTPNGLLAYYKFNQGLASGTNTSVTSLTDNASGSFNGTLTNFALTGSGSNWIAPGGVTTGVSCAPLCDSTSTAATAAGTYTSTQSYTSPSSGFTHYCDCQNKLLLSLKLGGTGAVIPDNGISLKINSTGSNFYANHVGFVGNSFGYAAMDRTWNVSPTTQPSSKVAVRFYFNSSDIASLDNTLTTNGLPGIFNANDLSFWKVINSGKPAHASVPSLNQGDVKVITYSSVATDTSWVLGNRTAGNYYAQFNVTGFSGGGGGAGPLGLTPLPVQLLYLTANGVNNKYIHVGWATASENNAARFDVERSENGKDFVKIGTVAAIGNSSTETRYGYNDLNAKAGILYYYRLKLVDNNNLSETSDMVAARLNLMIPTTLTLYPNPANTAVNLVWPEGLETADVKVISLDGKVLLSKNMNTATDNSISLKEFSNGVYLIHVNMNGTVLSSKIIVQH